MMRRAHLHGGRGGGGHRPAPALPRLLLAAACLWGGGAPAQSGDEGLPPEPSEIARLAERSLLLDAARAGGRIVAVGDRGHVLVSTNEAASWTQVVVPARSMLTAVVLFDDGQGWAVGHDAVILHTADGGDSWELQHWAPELEQPLFDVWFADAQHGLAVGAYGLCLETRDGGRTWAPRTIDEEEEPHHYQFSRGGSGTLYLVGEFGTIYRSDDAGATWTRSESPYAGSFFGTLALADDAVLVFGLRGNLFRSDDGGESWDAVDSGTTTGLFDGLQLPDGAVVLAGQSGMLCLSRDGGRTFTAHNLGTRESISSILALDGGRVLLVGESGVEVLESIDGVVSAPAEAGR